MSVVLITLDRPERRNAVDHDTLLALLEAQAQCAERPRRRVDRPLRRRSAPGPICMESKQGVFVHDSSVVLKGFTELRGTGDRCDRRPGVGCRCAVGVSVRPARRHRRQQVRCAGGSTRPCCRPLDRRASVARVRLAGCQSDAARSRNIFRGPSCTLWDRCIGSAGWIPPSSGLPRSAASLRSRSPVTSWHSNRRPVSPTRTRWSSTPATRAWASNDAEEGRLAFLEKRSAAFRGE